MGTKAIGLIETIGLAAAIEACDSALKSANVELLGYELTKGGGMVTIKIQGDVGAVNAAIESAKTSASKVNKVFTSVVIPRPHTDLGIMLESKDTVRIDITYMTPKINDGKSEISEDAVEPEAQKISEDTIESSNEAQIDNNFEVAQTSENGEEDQKVENLKEAEKEDICNLCKDPACPRKKGQPRNLCIHYKKM